jgi:hypothetical protein
VKCGNCRQVVRKKNLAAALAPVREADHRARMTLP